MLKIHLPVLCLSVVFALLNTTALAQAENTGALTVYRCIGRNGQVTLSDTPCPQNTQQQTRQMQRPRALEHSNVPVPAPAPVPSVPAAVAPTQVIVQQVYRTPPQPMYRCVRPDGGSYISDSNAGNSRWQPAWTLGAPVLTERIHHVPAQTHVRVQDGKWDVRAHTGYVRREVVPTIAGYGAMQWVQDRCHQLPQAQVCDTLRDEKRRLRDRFFNAQQTERDRIRSEERALNARIANDCT